MNQNNNSVSIPIIIIGGGPAGMTTAIQLRRYGIPALLIEKTRLGGLLWNANLVENYPGFPAGVSGPKLVHLIEKQVERLDVPVNFDEVLEVRGDGHGFRVDTRNTHYVPRFIIIASGTKPNPVSLAIPDEARERVFSEVHPLLGVKGKRVVIVGAGDAAFDYALNLSKKGNFVTILNRGRDVKCLSLLHERVEAEPSILYVDEITVRQVEALETGNRLRVRGERGGEMISLETDYLLFAIGRQPALGFLSPKLVEVKDQLVQSGKLYFVGDVANGLLRQTSIAVGDGMRAAMQIYFKINGVLE